MQLTSPVSSLSGVGDVTAQKLGKLGISTVFDLLYHLPFRYEDRSVVLPVASVRPGLVVTVTGTVAAVKNEYTRSGRIFQKTTLTDSTGSISVMWFNQPFLSRTFRAGMTVALWGKVDYFGSSLAFISPDYEIITPGHASLHTGRIVPVYPETAGLTSKWLRSRIERLLNELPVNEILPETMGLPNWKSSLRQVHFPQNQNSNNEARMRLAFDELFLLQLSSIARRKLWQGKVLAHPLQIDQEKIMNFINTLPFTLTASQLRSIREILSDLEQSQPMNRLLEGDVGSGKTVVAALAALVTYFNGFRTLVLTPTQILATQHYQTLSSMFRNGGPEVGLLISGVKSADKIRQMPLIVGTHALLSKTDAFTDIGLVIIDEQHRFGVAQRELAAKLGKTPHILTMTATPIPRTISLTMFGDLDLSILEDKPVGRLPVKTWIVPEEKREASYSWIVSQITSQKTQALWICPFIDDSESAVSVKAATSEYKNLSEKFSGLKLGLLHGKMKMDEKDVVMNRFRSGEIDILVATPIVEVGLDIPNISIIVIEGSERFGLAQLHQLRGRGGRNSIQSFCLLFTSDNSQTARLKAMETSNSGLELAEIDLKLRGPGEIFGTAQHGSPQFKVATYENLGLMEQAKSLADKVFPKLEQYPLLRDLVKEDKITLIRPN